LTRGSSKCAASHSVVTIGDVMFSSSQEFSATIRAAWINKPDYAGFYSAVERVRYLDLQ
jgi:hypothetical protein